MATRSYSLAIMSMLVLWMTTATVAFGYDVAPRISDREIIESLAELKQGHQALNQRIGDLSQKMDQRLNDMNLAMDQRFNDMNQAMDQRFNAMDQRFNDMNQAMDQRFNAVEQRFNDMNQAMDQRFNAVEQRFNDMNQKMDQRFTDLHNVVMTMFGSVMALIIVLIGYMIWDRKTAQQPLKQRVTNMEEMLDVNNPSGPNVSRLIIALRKLAETNAEVAGVLRSCSLL